MHADESTHRLQAAETQLQFDPKAHVSSGCPHQIARIGTSWIALARRIHGIHWNIVVVCLHIVPRPRHGGESCVQIAPSRLTRIAHGELPKSVTERARAVAIWAPMSPHEPPWPRSSIKIIKPESHMGFTDLEVVCTTFQIFQDGLDRASNWLTHASPQMGLVSILCLILADLSSPISVGPFGHVLDLCGNFSTLTFESLPYRHSSSTRWHQQPLRCILLSC